MPGEDSSGRRQTRGRTLGYAAFGLIVGALTAIFSTQILFQVFAPEGADAEVSCPQTIRHLWGSLNRARQSAVTQSDEQAGLAAFRASLLPEWRLLPALESGCGEKSPYRDLTRALVRLRYLEERGVRSDSGELVRERAAVSQLLASLPAPAADASQPPSTDLGQTP